MQAEFWHERWEQNQIGFHQVSNAGFNYRVSPNGTSPFVEFGLLGEVYLRGASKSAE